MSSTVDLPMTSFHLATALVVSRGLLIAALSSMDRYGELRRWNRSFNWGNTRNESRLFGAAWYVTLAMPARILLSSMPSEPSGFTAPIWNWSRRNQRNDPKNHNLSRQI